MKKPPEAPMQAQPTTKVRIPSEATKDNGKVRLGAQSPSMPALRATPANVAEADRGRSGAVAPSMPAGRAIRANAADADKVRVGAVSPSMPAVRATPANVAD